MTRKQLHQAAHPFMKRLHDQFGETVGLAVLDAKARKGLIIGAVQGTRHRFSFTLTPGTWFPLHTGAPAKAMLAFLRPAQQRLWLDHLKLTRYTPQTITTRKALKAELSGIAACGYALDRSEEVEGCHCVSAPVFDEQGHPLAAVWLTGPTNRLTVERLHAHAPAVREVTSRISQALAAGASASDPADQTLLVQRTIRHLTVNLSDAVDWKALSADLGVSYSTLRHVFATQSGQPPARYHLSLRLDEAKRLLKETALPVHAVAAKTGFSDPNHFSALFSKKTGISPTRFRETLPLSS